MDVLKEPVAVTVMEAAGSPEMSVTTYDINSTTYYTVEDFSLIHQCEGLRSEQRLSQFVYSSVTNISRV